MSAGQEIRGIIDVNLIPMHNLTLSLVRPTIVGLGGTYFQKITAPALNKL